MLVHDFLNHWALTTPDKLALIHGRERVSFAMLSALAGTTAYWLMEQGLAVGDRIAILTDNPTHYIASYFGILQAGGVAIGLNTQTSQRTLDNVLADSRPSCFLLSGRNKKYAEFIKNHRQQTLLQDISSLLDIEASTLDRDHMAATVTENNIAQIIYTSGTTGKPKGVMLSHKNLVANTKSIINYLGLTSSDSIMAVLPFFYSYGNSVMLTHIAAGGTLVVNQSFVYPNIILEQMAEEQVTGLSGVPSTFAILLHRSAARDFTFPHLRYLTQAGAAMSPTLAGKLKEVFPRSEIYIMYGQTEAAPRLSYLPPEDLARKPGSIGKAIPGVTLEILKEDGSPAAVGETGEIVAQGDNIMVGYWQQPEETARVLRDGKLWTGDLAYCDDDGYLFIVSRKSDMIKCGSHRIAPKEIEEIITEMDGVLEVAVVGQKDEILGEQIHAFVVGKSVNLLSVKDVTTFCRRNLPPFKVPHQVTFLDDLPKSESGKIKKQVLQQSQ